MSEYIRENNTAYMSWRQTVSYIPCNRCINTNYVSNNEDPKKYICERCIDKLKKDFLMKQNKTV
jgi:hypothetical protein